MGCFLHQNPFETGQYEARQLAKQFPKDLCCNFGKSQLSCCLVIREVLFPLSRAVEFPSLSQLAAGIACSVSPCAGSLLGEQGSHL